MAGVSGGGGGDVYGADVITSGKENQGKLTLTFSRQYRNRIVQMANYPGGNVQPHEDYLANNGWYVLPIQNSWTAALKPRDLAAMDNLFKSYTVDSIGIQLSQMNIVEANATVNQLQDTTIPNLVMEMYVDNDHDLPGYNEDFLTKYGTNNQYTTADFVGTTVQDADINLRTYRWRNTNDSPFQPAVELNLLGNGPGFKMMTQNEDFSFNWDCKNGKKRHTFVPWQYQQNNEYRELLVPGGVYPRLSGDVNQTRLLHDSYRSSSGGWFSPNAAAGSFPGGADSVRITGDTVTETAVVESRLVSVAAKAGISGFAAAHAGGPVIAQGTGSNPVNLSQAMVEDVGLQQNAPAPPHVETAAGQNAEYGLPPAPGYGPNTDYVNDSDFTHTSYYNMANRDQITGLPFIGDIPPYILLRPQIRSTQGVSTIEFIVKYRITITGERNVLGFYPMPVDPTDTRTSTWCGTGNLGFQTRPGVNRYRSNQPIGALGPVQTPYNVAGATSGVPEGMNPSGTPWGAVQNKRKQPTRPAVQQKKVQKLSPLVPEWKKRGYVSDKGGVMLPSGAVGFVGYNGPDSHAEKEKKKQ